MTDNDTQTLMDELATLKARVARLEARQTVAIKPDPEPADPRVPPGGHIGLGGLVRDYHGNPVPDPALPDYGTRMKARAADEQAADDERWGKATAGLPPGYWRDPCGLVRRRDGTQARRDEYAGEAV